MKDKEKIELAMDMIIKHGGHEGEHHKEWCLDQVFRILSGKDYDHLVKEAREGEGGPYTYEWKVGIAP